MDLYKIYDNSDDDYSEWYGSELEIEEYLDEVQDNIPNYDEERSWTDNIESYGLSYEFIRKIDNDLQNVHM